MLTHLQGVTASTNGNVEDMPAQKAGNKPTSLGPHEEGEVNKSSSNLKQQKISDSSKANNKKGFPVNDEEANKILNQSLKEQQVMLVAKKQELEKWDSNSQANFKTWFGTTNESDKKIIEQRIDKTLDMSKNYDVDKFRPAPPKYKDAYAVVNPDDKEHHINLGEPFWSAPTKGSDTKAGVLSHEMSHFNEIGGTDDYAYGLDDSKELAKINPKKALNNADNFEFYLENAK